MGKAGKSDKSPATPVVAVEALFPVPIDCGFGVEVHPLTLGHYALLEKIGSYLVLGGHRPDPVEVVRTYYVCTRPAADTVALIGNGGLEALDQAAFSWAETLPPAANQAMADAILKQVGAMMKVAPVGGKKKVRATAS